MIREGDKVKLKTSEIAIISEILEENMAFVAEVFRKDGGVSVEQISQYDILSVFEEVEHPILNVV